MIKIENKPTYGDYVFATHAKNGIEGSCNISRSRYVMSEYGTSPKIIDEDCLKIKNRGLSILTTYD